MLQDWLPYRETFISEILDLEAPPVTLSCSHCQIQQGCFRCKDCFSQALLCCSCCFAVHSKTPFHRIEKWTGTFFDTTSLNQEGFVLHLGHGGEPCPVGSQTGGLQGTQPENSDDEGEAQKYAEDVPLASWEKQDSRCLVVVDISGVHQLQVGWCQCSVASDHHIQLLRSRLFPASVKRPSTAFTFAVLDYFHIDAVECKISASSFFSKL